MSIQHLFLNEEPLLKEQVLADLKHVNILTGKNSSGKSTILRTILKKKQSGQTFTPTSETLSIIEGAFSKYGTPNRLMIRFMESISEYLKGFIIFGGEKNRLHQHLADLVQSMEVSRYPTAREGILSLTNDLLKHYEIPLQPVLLSPKRRLLHEGHLQEFEQLDIDAQNALSRLFVLKNSPLGERDQLCYQSIFDTFQRITGKQFDVHLKAKEAGNVQLRFRNPVGPWILAENEGQGLREILTIVLYSLDGEYNMILLEEPENHMHPDLQRQLLLFLNSVEDRQFILSTHSPVFVNPAFIDKVYLTRIVDSQILVADSTNRAAVLAEIGVLASDNLTSDAILITEGKNDQMIVEHVITNWIPTRRNITVSRVLLAGSNMQDFDPTPFAQFRNTFVILDLDSKNTQPQKVLKKKCAEVGVSVTQLARYSIESYYSIGALRSVFRDRIPKELTLLDPAKPLWTQVADTTHDSKWWEGMLKDSRNIAKILANMTPTDIQGTDLFDLCLKISEIAGKPAEHSVTS